MADEIQHQALYRRYRPQTPQEVLGQDHVIRALTGAIREGRLHHAFLFCGPRGTGKTSTARILAKMVNCEQGPTAEPCGVCSQCVAIREGTHLDVVEIDAASHGGVEDARELREKAPTAPVQGREKVYIIDEAQRLSREAFDALLKVFEEPPPGVRFVLATTEPFKMPATIVGRSQRFDFRRFGLETLTGQLQTIAEAEGTSLTESAAHSIARQAEGSSRDALSLLDQARVLGGDKIDDDVVHALLGAPRGEVQHELADSIAVGDARGAFEIVGRLVADGQDVRNVTNESLGPLPEPAPGQDRAGPAGPARRARRRVRPTADPGREVQPGRDHAGHRAAVGRAERHAVDHLAAPHAGTGVDPRHAPRHRPGAGRPGGAARTSGAVGAARPHGGRAHGGRRRSRRRSGQPGRRPGAGGGRGAARRR